MRCHWVFTIGGPLSTFRRVRAAESKITGARRENTLQVGWPPLLKDFGSKNKNEESENKGEMTWILYYKTYFALFCF